MRDYLRNLPVFSGALATFDPNTSPEDPAELFASWLTHAVEAGVSEPHAMTLSTCDAAGVPDGRVLILKDIDDRGWWFATNALSSKGIQLADTPAASLTFYWPQVGRQVRVRGSVIEGSAEDGAADFRARGRGARAVALASSESQPLRNLEDCVRAVAEAAGRLETEPELVASGWRTYAVAADTIEFWNADTNRQHIRVQYRRTNHGWVHGLLWP